MKKIETTRWLLYVLIFLSVLLPLIFQINLPITETKVARGVYNLIEDANENANVIISFDYDPSSKPELQPMAVSVIRHCLRRNYNMIFTALWPMGVQMASGAVETVRKDNPHLEYGTQYVNLGYKAGGMVTLQKMGKDLRDVFPADMSGTSIDSLALLDGINSLNDIDFIISLSAGVPGIKEWIMVGHDKYGRSVAGGTTAVTAPNILPYVNDQNQLSGLLGGLKAAAEYEKMTGASGTATAGMDAQSIAHLVIIIFVILGNVRYHINKKRGEE
ncbi:MAG: hypothetical protein K8S56_03960 [Candidatus Cloacimonetes bacterium]|nr:hypothetical protein [Candidatus Cloacimonadota bacterium]